jgi:uncharacterized protein (DUF362 family)
MEIHSSEVGLIPCPRYDRALVKEGVAALCISLGFTVPAGSKVLLKPNLVSGRRKDGLACTQAEFVAGTAEWFLDLGARVTVGDSPAFGTAKGVMSSCGIAAALGKYPVTLTDFDEPVAVTVPGGLSLKIARPALECDFLINLPRVKAHGQLLITLAVKNYFGTVIGFRKAALHARLGGREGRFEAMLVDLLEVLPGGISLIDGVIAMHQQGPVNGKPFPLGIIGGALNPVALDTALLQVLGIDPEQSPLWRECRRRNLPGSRQETLYFPLGLPGAFPVSRFQVPGRLKPVSFHPLHLFISAMKRVRERCRPKLSR